MVRHADRTGNIRAAHQLHSPFIDVNEITDRTENGPKMIGDIYAARLFHLTAARLALQPWKASVAVFELVLFFAGVMT